MKKISSLILTFVIALTLVSCSSTDKSWAMKNGDTTISMEAYTYYCLTSYESAVYMVDSSTKVLESTIDDMSASDYIFGEAMRYCQTYLWLDEQVGVLNIEYTDQEIDDADYLTEIQIEYMGDYLEYYGISEEAFHSAYTMYSLNYQKVFEALYSEGGEFEVSDEEFLEYYSENYYSYQYLFAPVMTTDEDGQSVDISDEEKAELEEIFTEYLEAIQNNELSVEECANNYMELTNMEVAPYNNFSNNISTTSFPTGFAENLEIMENGEVIMFESDGILVVMMKNDITETAANLDDNTKLYSIMEDKWFEYNSYVYAQATTTMADIEINEEAISTINLEDFVTDYNEYGYEY